MNLRNPQDRPRPFFSSISLAGCRNQPTLLYAQLHPWALLMEEESVKSEISCMSHGGLRRNSTGPSNKRTLENWKPYCCCDLPADKLGCNSHTHAKHRRTAHLPQFWRGWRRTNAFAARGSHSSEQCERVQITKNGFVDHRYVPSPLAVHDGAPFVT